MDKIVVIGAGQAGSSLTAKLRALGHTGPITLIGEEGAPPYQRPPLSKKYLLGEMELERLYLRPESFYADNNITLHTAETAIAIDRKDKVVIAGGQQIAYDQLALTTGSVPRTLPGKIGGAWWKAFGPQGGAVWIARGLYRNLHLGPCAQLHADP